MVKRKAYIEENIELLVQHSICAQRTRVLVAELARSDGFASLTADHLLTPHKSHSKNNEERNSTNRKRSLHMPPKAMLCQHG